MMPPPSPILPHCPGFPLITATVFSLHRGGSCPYAAQTHNPLRDSGTQPIRGTGAMGPLISLIQSFHSALFILLRDIFFLIYSKPGLQL